jgi:hypothetical protein
MSMAWTTMIVLGIVTGAVLFAVIVLQVRALLKRKI